MQLFRAEAMRGQDRLHGEVVLVPPVSWRLLGGFLIVAVAVAAAYLATVRYTVATPVTGALTGDEASVDASPARAGILRQVLVHDGEHVAAGAALAQVAGDAGANASFLVTAPEAGTVSGIQVQPGDAVDPGRPLMSIVPDGTRLHARIEIPAAAARFVEPGQTIRIAVDAFPYRSHGTVEARVESVSEGTVPVARPGGSRDEVLVLRASLAEFDRPLRPGMTVSARIPTGTRTLGEWLFEPLVAAVRR